MTDTVSDPPLTRSANVRRLAVYPPLGVARVGDATGEDDYVVGPEVVGGAPTLPDGRPAHYLDDFRSPDGAIRRQAARFRVYAELADGGTRELTTDDGVDIRWRVRLANLKAGWYEFLQAMDLPGGLAKPAPRRNPAVAGVDRALLDVTPAPRAISGGSQGGRAHSFDDGAFCGAPVYLGELRTDAAGRLLVLGGHGRSASHPPNQKPTTFANNNGWHDDVSDGPVHATVVFPDGTALEAEPGFVAVTPPNYAPGVNGLVTMDDAVRETFQAEGWIAVPTATSFVRDLWPIFLRLTELQWVNHGWFIASGEGSPLNAHAPDVLARLRDGSAGGAAWRRALFSLFRTAGGDLEPDTGELPAVFADGFGEIRADENAIIALVVTPTMYAHLRRWAEGDFDDDWPGAPPQPARFDDLPPEGQCAQLERAALHDCLGGPFHPGIELTWTMRLAGVWAGPYRLKVLPEDAPARQDWGDVLQPAACLGPGGPYDGVAAGALTRFMGVPWQTDEASCNSDGDYHPSYFLSMPTFWGPRVPDQVLSSESYARMAALPADAELQRLKHFAHRSDWLRDIRATGYFARIANMVREWQDLGMVLPVRDAPAHLPPGLRVEQGRSADFTRGDVRPALVARVESLVEDAPSPAGAAAGLAPEAPAAPPRRSYRQGEI